MTKLEAEALAREMFHAGMQKGVEMERERCMRILAAHEQIAREDGHDLVAGAIAFTEARIRSGDDPL